MKKLFLLVAVILMTFFVVSQVQANPRGGEISLKIDPIEPYAIPNDGTHEVDFSWTIKIDQVESIGCSLYTFSIYDEDGNKIGEPLEPFPRPIQQEISRDYSWTIPKGLEIGRYRAKIIHPGPNLSAEGYFFVGGGDLKVVKFHDRNRNGEWDKENEEGIAGWNFTIVGLDGSIIHRTTGPDGTFTERNLMIEKLFKVTEELKPHWIPTTPTLVETEVELGRTKEVKFGNYGFGTLAINKFEDFNRNGVQDAGEKDLANWVFEVTQDGRTVDKCTTEEKGSCKLELPAGRYTITEELKTGWRATTPITQEAEVKVCQETRVSFGNNRSISLIITKYYDHNMNGKRDSGEEGIGNWGFKIKYPDGSVETVTTDSDGIYERYDPPTGKYTISEQPQPCWKNSTPRIRDVEITSDQGEEVEFGNYEFGTLVIYKFNDTDHNGTWDEGELPLPNWGFRVKSADGFIDIPDIPNTDEKGSITVELPANIWFNVTDTFLVGWRNSTPHTQSVYIKPCEDTPAIFGNYIPTPIIIHKFNDTNGNGIRDNEEEGLAGWDFWIYGPNVNEIFTTDENGRVRYEDAIPGQYRIEERPREDQGKYWRSTTSLIREVTVENRQPKPEYFGNRYTNGTLCKEYGLYDVPPIEPEWYPKSDGYLNVSKYLEPHIVHCDSPNLQEGEIINVTLRVCAFAGMSPTDLVIAVDTSGSLIERGGVVLEVMRDGIIAFMEKNKDKFGENVRVGLVSWDEDIDETVGLTTNYSNVIVACERLSSNAEEDTLYHVGLNGSIDVFARSPRGNATKVIVLITDAKGTTDGLSSYSQLDTSGYVIHAITVGTEQNNGTVKMLENVTSQHSGVVKSVFESSDELAKELTALTVTSIERRILNNVTVIETLPKYLRALNESYTIPPTSVQINQDGIDWSTETIVWDIGNWSSDKCWECTFKALFCCQMPADESHPIGIPKNTSEVTYTDPTNSSITRHLPIPEGIIWIRSRPQPTPEPSGFEALLAIAGLLAVAYLVWRRRR